MTQYHVIKLGGSIVSPSVEQVFDFAYLTKLRAALQPFMDRGDKFFLAVGGGAMCRKYQELAKNAGVETLQLHWIGTTFNVLNAEMVRAYFCDAADDLVYKYEDFYNSDPLTIYKSIKVGGGGRPGVSGDADALKVAQKFAVKTVISLKNIDAVYSADPKKEPQAKRLRSISWQEYLDIIGNPGTHQPGANFPVDPLTAKLASEGGFEFKICSGWNLHELTNILNGQEFIGTTIAG